MSNIVVITFDDPEAAGKLRDSVHKTEKSGFIQLDDSAIIVKDEHGKVHVKNELDRGVKVGAVGGGFLGLLIGFMFAGPFGSLIVGALAGGLIGASADLGISKKFVEDVSNDLEPNSSALFIVVRDSDPDKVVATLGRHEGNVYHTSLPPEAEETLRRSLSGK